MSVKPSLIEVQVSQAETKSRVRAAWLAWSLWAMYVVLAALSLVLESHRDITSFSVSLFGDLVGLAFITVGAVIASRGHGGPIGWILIAAPLTIMFSVFAANYAFYALVTRPGSLPGAEVMAWLSAWTRNIGLFLMFTFLLLLFPTGKLLSPNWRPLAWLAASNIVLLSVVEALRPGPLAFAPALTNPYGIEGAGDLLRLLETVLLISMLGIIGACVASVIIRFRRATGDESAQLKWFVYAAVLAGVVVLILPFLPVSDDVYDAMLVLAIATMPVAIAIAIFKYRLYDIDLIINRTLVYVPLTAILAGLYAALNKVLENVFISITGDTSDAAIVLTTLILAATFSPIKGALQKVVDRFFKEAPDTTRGLKALKEELESRLYPVDERLVARRFLNEAVQAFQAQGGAIYLMRDGQLELAHASEGWDESDAQITVRLESNGANAGLLKLGPRRNGSGYTEKDSETLSEVASVVADATVMRET